MTVRPGEEGWDKLVLGGYGGASPVATILQHGPWPPSCRAARVTKDPCRQYTTDEIWRRYHWDGEISEEAEVEGAVLQGPAFQ